MVSYLKRARRPAADRARRAPHRGHLAVPVPRRLLAARSGHDGRDLGGRHRAVGHQGQGRGHAAVPAAGRRIPNRAARLRPRIGQDTAELFDSVREHLAQGFKAMRMQTGMPGLKSVYGIASNATLEGNAGKRYDHEPAQRGAFPSEEDWDTRSYLRHLAAVSSRRCATSSGPSCRCCTTRHHRMTPIQAAKLGKSLEPYDLFWLEDCTPAENQEALRLVRQHTTTPAGDRRDLQLRLGLPAADPASSSSTTCAARSRTRGGITPAAQASWTTRRAVPDQVGHARADRHLAGRHGRRDAPGARASTTSASRST